MDIAKYFLLVVCGAILSTLSFDCNLLTGPHKSTGPDTTSSAFTWTIDTIGAEGSILYDCVVINDTLTYAVGKLFPRDSLGRSNQSDLYNAAVWNGTKWTMIKVPRYYQGQDIPGPVYSVYATSPNDIWFGTGDLVHWNGSRYSQLIVIPWLRSPSKIWESSDRAQLYVVGMGGTAAYSPDHGSTWQQVQTGTTLPFQDIWGDGGQVLAIGSDEFGLGGKYLVQLNGNTATHLNDSIPTAVSLSGIWFKANQKYFLVGDGVLTKNSLSDRLWQYDFNRTAASYYSFAIRGAGLDNIVIAGGYGDISFFNGARWTEYKELYNPIDQLRSVSISGNTIVAAGIRTYSGIQYYGVAYVGRR
ncbi:MAG: hypothetical protein M1469_05400 [Bacteroidetes bacterium]|nr:hypothetical protein [Bacteroidota bacterium]